MKAQEFVLLSGRNCVVWHLFRRLKIQRSSALGYPRQQHL